MFSIIIHIAASRPDVACPSRLLGRNITAAIRDEPLENFVYQQKGTLAALGHFKGAGKIGKFEISGFLAWWVWRTYYLMQMRGWARKIRIVLDWTIALFFKNDIVQLDLRRPEPKALK